MQDTLKLGYYYRFDYPPQFVSLEAYSAHRMNIVQLIRPLPDEEYDAGEVERMYEVKAADGWIGHAFESELVEL